jgi:SNF2 family DNA or RNA helicase
MLCSKTNFNIFQQVASWTGLDYQDHQADGLHWLLHNEMRTDPTQGVRGGILADEMGLGKTIQMIATILVHPVKNTLIVLPLALIDQWKNEIKRIAKHDVLVYHGYEATKIDQEALETAPIVLTTYGMVQNNRSGDLHLLHKLVWGRIVYDEAHHLRNMKTKSFSGASRLQSPIKWLMTGTPIQNKKSDFYALCHIIGFKPEYYSNPKNLITIAKGFLLKRTKEGVGLTLPKCSTHKVVVPWENDDERALAKDVHSLLRFTNVPPQMVNLAIEQMDGENDARSRALRMLTLARQICVFPKLAESKVMDDLDDVDPDECEYNVFRAFNSKSKLNAVMNHIEAKRGEGKNKLVFCNFRGEIDFISMQLERKGFSVAILDGRTKKSERDARLKEKHDVLVLQIRTGCEGLNLQHYSQVYFVSPHWNPAVESQAIARCHRMGQKNDVDIYCFQMDGFDDEDAEDSVSLDQYCLKLQDRKREIMDLFEKDRINETPQ